MSDKYPGGFVTLTPPALNPALGASTPGIWTIDQALNAKATRSWPIYDPYWQNTMVMLHGNGTNGAQNNTFLDSSSNNFTVTRNGDTTQGTFSPYDTLWSNYFDGNGDSLTLPSVNINFGSSNFTFEMWVYPTALSGTMKLFGGWSGASGYQFWLGTSGRVIWQFGASNSPDISALYITANRWWHIAWVRSGNSMLTFINGVLKDTTAYTGTVNSANTPTIGKASDSAADYYVGYISNLRAVAGTAIYTSNFTPSTVPLTAVSGTSLLTCQSNRFIDNSSNAYAITRNGDTSVQLFTPFASQFAYTPELNGGSAYFDGTGDYLTIANNTNLQFGTGNFTVECWVYQPAQSGLHNTVIGKWDTGFTTTGDWAFRTRFNGVTQFAMTLKYASGYYDIQTNVNVSDSSWHHLAVVRDSSTTIKLYIDGVLRTTQTISASDIVGSTATMSVGGNVNTAPNEVASTGYVSNVRIVKGTAVYTGNFTPPTAPLTAITNTSLLLNMTNAGIIDNSMTFDWRTINTAQISTSQKKYGTGSIFFNGSSYMNIAGPSYTNLSFGTADFTIEGWVYSTVNNSQNIIFDTRSSDTGTAPVWYTDVNGTLIWRRSNINLIGAGTISINQWIFIAISRINGVIRQFVNGVLVGSSSDTTNYVFATNPQIGKAWDSNYWNGYIDDFRITMGVGRYLLNFTPPTSQLQDF